MNKLLATILLACLTQFAFAQKGPATPYSSSQHPATKVASAKAAAVKGLKSGGDDWATDINVINNSDNPIEICIPDSPDTCAYDVIPPYGSDHIFHPDWDGPTQLILTDYYSGEEIFDDLVWNHATVSVSTDRFGEYRVFVR